MENDLLLCREGIQFSAETVQISVDDRGASVFRAFEEGVFDKVGDSAMESFFVPGSAFDAQCTIAYSRSALLRRILQSIFRSSADHDLSFVIALWIFLMSSGVNPGASVLLTLSFLK